MMYRRMEKLEERYKNKINEKTVLLVLRSRSRFPLVDVVLADERRSRSVTRKDEEGWFALSSLSR